MIHPYSWKLYFSLFFDQCHHTVIAYQSDNHRKCVVFFVISFYGFYHQIFGYELNVIFITIMILLFILAFRIIIDIFFISNWVEFVRIMIFQFLLIDCPCRKYPVINCWVYIQYLILIIIMSSYRWLMHYWLSQFLRCWTARSVQGLSDRFRCPLNR